MICSKPGPVMDITVSSMSSPGKAIHAIDEPLHHQVELATKKS